MANLGDTPHIVYGEQSDYKKIVATECYNGDPNYIALPKTIQAGYGKLEAGTAMAENKSAAGGDGKLVPYNPTSFTGAEDHPGRAYLVADSGTTATDLYVTITDSYKFGVGDDVIINDDDTTAENLGAITAIDRTSEQHRAKITVTTATGGTSFTTADYAYIAVEAGDSSNNYSDCVGILEKTVDTGDTANAQGATARIIKKNAVLYSGMLTNVDAAARTDLSASTSGQFTIF